MFEGKRVLAVVPARGGSKGVKLKNLRAVGGRSLVALAGDVVKSLPWIDLAVVSTDHPDIARAARDAGLQAPFMRPEDIAGDRIADWDVLAHALRSVEEGSGGRFDVVLMLQPTSPSRRPEHVEAAIRQLVDGGFDSVWTVSETDSKAHPLKQLCVGQSGSLAYYDPAGAKIIARQQLSPVYHRNGIAYAITRQCLLEQKSIMGAKPGAVVVEGLVFNIDTELDLHIADLLLRFPLHSQNC
jgi:CMP-N,N'-diacetyllegionaminic acid synthase